MDEMFYAWVMYLLCVTFNAGPVVSEVIES